MTGVSALNPDSYPAYPGVAYAPTGYKRFVTTQKDIDEALEKLDLEAAKNAIHNCCGGNSSLETQQQLIRIIDKIIELNLEPLSTQHKELNYTLKAAYSLGCEIYTNAINNRSNPAFMQCAIEAITKVANASADKGDYCEAIHYLKRLDDRDAQGLVKQMFAKWNSYIENECPEDQRKRQQFLYSNRKEGHEVRAAELRWEQHMRAAFAQRDLMLGKYWVK